MAKRPPVRGLLAQADDTALFGMCVDCQRLELDAVNVSTTEVRSQLTQQVFPQSKGLGGFAQDPVDGSGIVHVIWGADYLFMADPGNAVLTNPVFAVEAAGWISRDRESGVGIARLNQADEQDFAKVIHGASFYDYMRLIAGTGSACEVKETSRNYWFNQPLIAIAPYYLDCRVDALSSVALTFKYQLQCYVYYQAKRVNRAVYQYLMEKYTTGTGGMKSRAREFNPA